MSFSRRNVRPAIATPVSQDSLIVDSTLSSSILCRGWVAIACTGIGVHGGG